VAAVVATVRSRAVSKSAARCGSGTSSQREPGKPYRLPARSTINVATVSGNSSRQGMPARSSSARAERGWSRSRAPASRFAPLVRRASDSTAMSVNTKLMTPRS